MLELYLMVIFIAVSPIRCKSMQLWEICILILRNWKLRVDKEFIIIVSHITSQDMLSMDKDLESSLSWNLLCISLLPGSTICVGSEWHRFPSSFFIPDFVKEVRWIDDGFRGLLPFPFNSTLGGTAAAPPYFNNKNKASDEQYVHYPHFPKSFSLLISCYFFSWCPFVTVVINKCYEHYSSEISMRALSLSSFNSIDRMLLVEATHQSGR